MQSNKHIKITLKYIFILIIFFSCTQKNSKQFSFLDVEELPEYKMLPNPLSKQNGSIVKSKKEWKHQRDYLKNLLAFYQYGHMPPCPETFTVEESKIIRNTENNSIQSSFKLVISNERKIAKFRVGIFRPDRTGKFPVIIKNDIFLFDSLDINNIQKRNSYAERGQFEIEKFVQAESIKRDYIQCKFIRDDVAADKKDNRNSGVFPLYPVYDWGTIAAWAWAYQLIINYLEEQDYVDTEKIVATGHSRGGKTALCAGIYDERISIVAPNSSGSGGTGSWLYFDSTKAIQNIAIHQKNHSYWWHPRLLQFVDEEKKLPFDSHFAKILIAPRHLLNTHARQDFWANPYGTYLTHLAALPLFNWLDAEGRCNIHWRDGGHNQNAEDWLALFDFCDKVFFSKKTNRIYNVNPLKDLYQYDPILKSYLKNIKKMIL